MYCLYCGDCCLRMSPVTGNGEPCPNIKKVKDFYFCGNYSKRPQECQDHDFPSRFCPIGMDELGLKTPDQVRNRIDMGWEMCNTLDTAQGLDTDQVTDS